VEFYSFLVTALEAQHSAFIWTGHRQTRTQRREWYKLKSAQRVFSVRAQLPRHDPIEKRPPSLGLRVGVQPHASDTRSFFARFASGVVGVDAINATPR
jgi:hypothetical protein